jgi:hypothetical protein
MHKTMNQKILTLAAALLLAWVFGAAHAVAAPKSETLSSLRTDRAIERTRSGNTVHIRTKAAQELMEISTFNPGRIGDQHIAAIAALLDSPDDSVRYWVARCLGNLGPRAAHTVPKLLEILPHADCLRGSLTSASGIRLALAQMGTLPPEDACAGSDSKAGNQLR